MPAPMRGPRVVGGRGHCPVLLMTDEETEITWRGVKAKHLIPDSPLGVLFRCPHVSFTSFTVVTETPLNGNSWENDLSWPPRDTPCGACRLSPFHLAPSCVESISLVESLKKASSCWGIQAFLSWSPYFPEKGQRHKQQTFY